MGYAHSIGWTGIAMAIVSANVLSAPMARTDDTSVARGRQLYRTHCATCHGTSGQGDGPMVEYLRLRPADLTRMTTRNRGVFPAEALHRAIDGRERVKAHGDSAMPVWGDVFSLSGPAETGGATTERIRALIAYLESIQERSGD